MQRISIKHIVVIVAFCTIGPAWHLNNQVKYQREERIIESLRKFHSQNKLGGMIRVVDSQHPGLPFEANWNWYVIRKPNWFSRNLPNWLTPVQYERVNELCFLERNDQLLEMSMSFGTVEKLTIIDEDWQKSEVVRRLCLNNPKMQVELLR